MRVSDDLAFIAIQGSKDVQLKIQHLLNKQHLVLIFSFMPLENESSTLHVLCIQQRFGALFTRISLLLHFQNQGIRLQ